MAGEKRAAGKRDQVSGGRKNASLQGDGLGRDPGHTIPPAGTGWAGSSGPWSLPAVVFLLSFFFIVTVTSPGLYINDEWITANQLHQLDLGHQVTFNEGKYGVFENGTSTAYFTSRQNVLMYSLALPLSALPVVKLFSIFGDNFRLLVIVLWSLSLVAAALLLDAYYPRWFRAGGIRFLYPVVIFAFLLFLVNILLYKQFPFSAADAPFEVAALVLANHLFFALTVTLVFALCRRVLGSLPLACIGTSGVISCSSFLFWAGTAKDHMLAAAVFTCVMYFFVKYLSDRKPIDAGLSFFACGLLIWVRPEVGFFVTILAGLFYILPLVVRFRQDPPSPRNMAEALLPPAAAFAGGIPFFLNNLVVSHNLLIPAFDLPRNLVEPGRALGSAVPGTLNPLPVLFVQGDSMDLISTFSRTGDLIFRAMFSGFSFENSIRGFTGVMLFPANGHIGFLIMCPLVLIAVVALILWSGKILSMNRETKVLCLFFLLMGIAAILAYLPKLGSMNISSGILPDMRYLSPAYIPFGILSIMVLARTPLIRDPDRMVKNGILAGIVLVPVLMFVMIAIHPFGNVNEGYTLFFEVLIVLELVLCSLLMIIRRFVLPGNRLLTIALPAMLILVIISVLTFQLVLVFIFGVIVKVNGYPLWIPFVREGFRTLFSVTVLPPV